MVDVNLMTSNNRFIAGTWRDLTMQQLFHRISSVIVSLNRLWWRTVIHNERYTESWRVGMLVWGHLFRFCQREVLRRIRRVGSKSWSSISGMNIVVSNQPLLYWKLLFPPTFSTLTEASADCKRETQNGVHIYIDTRPLRYEVNKREHVCLSYAASHKSWLIYLSHCKCTPRADMT